jgi:hypothetical protein
MVKFLYNGQYAPIFERVGAIKAPLEDVVKAFIDWKEPQVIKSGNSLKNARLKGSLEDVFIALQPLKYPLKEVFIPAYNGYTFFTNNRPTAESGRISLISKFLNVPAFEVWAFYKTEGKQVNGWGGGMFSKGIGFDFSRTVYLIKDLKWDFHQRGEPFPFEELERYNEKLARNRFTPDMLERYCQQVGIDFFNEDFYMPSGSEAIIIETVRPPFPNEKSMTLEEVRRNKKYD